MELIDEGLKRELSVLAEAVPQHGNPPLGTELSEIFLRQKELKSFEGPAHYQVDDLTSLQYHLQRILDPGRPLTVIYDSSDSTDGDYLSRLPEDVRDGITNALNHGRRGEASLDALHFPDYKTLEKALKRVLEDHTGKYDLGADKAVEFRHLRKATMMEKDSQS
ncbi:hypothetical protein FRB91_003726 [Serendipita sp. 411]|nr:hypothetical protein FRC16_004071 [Serendipita sp. 398]KAG8828007.1 hypothetical protein FRC19_010515 [Serendipita sp. 401]KAG8833814.1 hypothetical protein FRC18_003027 [Serendipita sp. 400]KAG8861603.1 hypothetical protein FRB91_003726 [Serendipita sp. 411]KAG8867787.1 hypothetical protein FRC20_004883 [Serendipita sp. 405]